MFFWLGIPALLGVALVLRRWHAEDMARRLADTRRRRAAEPRGGATEPARLPWRDVAPDTLPEETERASA